jgi:IS30 family transposase
VRRGAEVAQHERFTIATDVQVYFCDPQRPWQRGSNENTNGLLRRYFPHGMDLTRSARPASTPLRANSTPGPRQTLGWRTPAVVLADSVATTG